jgi:hypothetical protein
MPFLLKVPVFEFIFALVEEETFKGARFVDGIKIRRVFG